MWDVNPNLRRVDRWIFSESSLKIPSALGMDGADQLEVSEWTLPGPSVGEVTEEGVGASCQPPFAFHEEKAKDKTMKCIFQNTTLIRMKRHMRPYSEMEMRATIMNSLTINTLLQEVSHKVRQ